MKTTFLILVSLLTMSTGLQAQSFGLHIGGNLASAKIKEDGSIFPLAPESKFGFLAGVVAEIPIAKSVSFRPELNFIQKGYKVSISEDFGTGMVYSINGKETLNYLEVPLNFTYNLPAGKHTVFLGAGPTVGLGLSGKSELTYVEPGQPTNTEKDDISFGSDKAEDDYKLLDLGLNVNGGFKLDKGFFVKLAYTFGFSNLLHDEQSSQKNKGFSFSVGYFFPKTSK